MRTRGRRELYLLSESSYDSDMQDCNPASMLTAATNPMAACQLLIIPSPGYRPVRGRAGDSINDLSLERTCEIEQKGQEKSQGRSLTPFSYGAAKVSASRHELPVFHNLRPRISHAATKTANDSNTSLIAAGDATSPAWSPHRAT
jgi:hypothetical protein